MSKEIIYIVSLKKQLKPIESDLINECINQRPAVMRRGDFNFLIDSKHTQYLYRLFLKESKKLLKVFNLKDKNFKTWCSISDDKFNITCWHNHIKSSTINGVLYLQLTRKEEGIDFLINQKIQNYLPKPFDLFIFPNYLDHCPRVSKTKEKRISLNFELRCKEEAINIFN